MKLGFSTLGTPAWTVDRIAGTAARLGYDGVELRMVEGTVDLHTLPAFGRGGLAATRAAFSGAGVEVFCIDTSVRLGALGGAERQAQLDLAAAMLAVAAGLSVPRLRVFGGRVDERAPTPDDLPRYADALATLADLARPHGVTVLLETHDTFSTGRSVADLLATRRQADNVAVLWDVLHSYRHGEPFDRTLDLIGDRLALVHLKDAATFDPGSFDLTLLGDGVLPLADALRLLGDRGYHGYLSFEWEKGWHPELAEPDVALPHYIATIKALLDAPAR